MEKKSVHIRLSKNDYNKLTSLAHQLGCARASVVRMILRAHPETVTPWQTPSDPTERVEAPC